MANKHQLNQLGTPPPTEVVLARFPNLPEDIAQVLREILAINEQTLEQARKLVETDEARLIEEAKDMTSFKNGDIKLAISMSRIFS